MTKTNIKNIPDGNYFTECGYSQQYPWVEIKRTAKTVTVAKVRVVKDPDWKPEMHPGGFAAHCSNQSEQTWIYDGVNMEHTRTIRRVKSPYCGEETMWAHRGTRFIEGRAVEFYDYNF
jgi:hypothetical protein